MKKVTAFLVALTCLLSLGGCGEKHETGKGEWNCSVAAAEDNAKEAYIITYSEEEIVSTTGELTFQNRNDFAITVHLIAAGMQEEVLEIPAGKDLCLKQIEKKRTYTAGVHADVAEGTAIKLMVYDGV